MAGYYDERLSAERLRRCYELAPPRVQQYLHAELLYMLKLVGPPQRALELGCGYGRVLDWLAPRCQELVGIDTSPASVDLARQRLAGHANCRVLIMDAAAMEFPNTSFDLVVCIQNGISAFHVDPQRLLTEALRVLRPGGRALFSSYAAAFWPHRLDWFRRQAAAGLVGEIDEVRTRFGVIVCKDGFEATTVSPEDFRNLAGGLPARCRIETVDDSSVFCELTKT